MDFVNTTLIATYNARGCDNTYGTIQIPNKVQKCTSDLFVYYECDGAEKAGCADKNFFISPHCATIECQSSVRNVIDNEYVNIRTVDNLILVDIKPYSWKRIGKFLYQVVNDTNDYVFILLILVLIGFFIFLLKFFFHKLESNDRIMRPEPAPVFSSAPVFPSAPALPLNTYEQTYAVYSENPKKKTNKEKESPPLSGTVCKACDFMAKSNAGLNTHVKAMLNRTNSSKTTHSQYYKK